MKTAGQILKSNRIAKNINLEDVTKKTKIRKLYLEAIEKDDYQVFDSLAMVLGFIKSYARYLGLDDKQLASVFKRDFDLSKTGQIVPRRSASLSPIKNRPRRYINFMFLPLFLIIGVSITLMWLYRWYILPPPIKIYQPKQVEVVTQERLIVKGRTLPKAKVVINDFVTYADQAGWFQQPVLLISGVNQIVVEVKFKYKTKIKTIDVIYRPQE